jgi:hypothetical protein
MDDEQFQAFLDSAVEELDRKDALLRETYSLGSLGRWWFDQSTQTVQFFDKDDRLVVEADAIAIGSFAPESGSWRWAWANESALPEMRERSEPVRELAQATGIDIFDAGHAFEIDGEDMAWELVAMSVRHLGAVGAYRMPSEGRPLFTYLALMDVRHVTP